MNEALEVTLMVTGVLERLAVAYLLGGSLASSLHGIPRATQDADLVADLRVEHVAPLAAELGPGFYEDVVLQKLIWYRKGGEASERQWRDVIGVLKIGGQALDLSYLASAAARAGVTDLLDRAREEAGRKG